MVSELDLVDAVLAGDRTAHGELFRRYRDFAVRLLVERGRTLRDIDDLVQDAFLLLPGILRRSTSRRPSICVVRAVERALQSYGNRSATGGAYAERREDVAPELLAQLPSSAVSPEVLASHREDLRRAAAAIERLRPFQRRVLLLRASGAEPAEVAIELGLTRGSVVSMTVTARRALEQDLAA